MFPSRLVRVASLRGYLDRQRRCGLGAPARHERSCSGSRAGSPPASRVAAAIAVIGEATRRWQITLMTRRRSPGCWSSTARFRWRRRRRSIRLALACARLVKLASGDALTPASDPRCKGPPGPHRVPRPRCCSIRRHGSRWIQPRCLRRLRRRARRGCAGLRSEIPSPSTPVMSPTCASAAATARARSFALRGALTAPEQSRHRAQRSAAGRDLRCDPSAAPRARASTPEAVR
jgi:hypothetical protein